MQAYRIYQVKMSKTRLFGNMGRSMMDSLGVRVDLDNYDEVYSGHVEDRNPLEYLFQTFNFNHPSDYKGRSMSVGDIVQLENELYFCDSFGWEKLKVNFSV